MSKLWRWAVRVWYGVDFYDLRGCKVGPYPDSFPGLHRGPYVNLIIGTSSRWWVRHIFGPFDRRPRDPVYRVDESFDLADVAVALDKVPSKSAARKRGWQKNFCKDVVRGWEVYRLGKTGWRIYVFIYNPLP